MGSSARTFAPPSDPQPHGVPMRAQLIATAVVMLLTGCATSVDDVHHYSTRQLGPSLSMVTSSSQLVVTNADGSVCVGPPPDATADLGFSANVALVGGAQDGSAGGGEEELPLGGRNPNVLITRDLLFQSCLAEARLKLSPDERKAHYQNLLQVITAINAKTLDGAAIQSDAESANQRITVPNADIRPEDSAKDDD